MIDPKLIIGHWYHGDAKKYTTFKGRYMDTEDFTRDRNAMGPGIYFTRFAWQASGYAGQASGYSGHGYVYDVTMDLNPKRVMTVDDTLDQKVIKKFMDLAPSDRREIGLSNYDNNVWAAVGAISDSSENLHDALCGVYGDFYGRDSRAFAAAMVKIGYDAYLHRLPEVDQLIVWNTDVINIVEVKPVSKYKNLKSYNEFK